MVSSMTSLATKQLIVGMICHTIALGILAYGVYAFYWQMLVPPELTRSVAVAVFFMGMGLEPKMFFTPLNQVVLQAEEKTIRAKVQGLVFNFGVFLFICSFLMEWLYD